MFQSPYRASNVYPHLRGFILLAILLFGSPGFSQIKRDTVWVGYDRGKADSLVTYDGRYIGTAYAHQVADFSFGRQMVTDTYSGGASYSRLVGGGNLHAVPPLRRDDGFFRDCPDSDIAIAIACLRLFTFLPLLPDLSLPRLNSCISSPTFH